MRLQPTKYYSFIKRGNNHMKKIVAIAALVALSTTASARDIISVVGSSTVYPFATVVAEQFGRSTQFKTPKIESTGSGGGLKLFCAGIGVEHPDVTNASRAIKKSEVERCASNGVTDIREVKIGYDGITIAQSKEGAGLPNLTTRDLFLALAMKVPNPDGSQTLVDNPYQTWADVREGLPAIKIEVLGPPPTSGTRDAFLEIAMEGGAKSIEWIKAIRKEDKKKFKAIAHGIREDGAYIDAGENDNLIIQKLRANPLAVGIFGFSFLDNNTDTINGIAVNGVAPEFETIADGSYPISRSLYFYVKGQHVDAIPGLVEYVQEFLSDGAAGEEGYLSEKGLIPLSATELEKVRAEVLR